MKYKIEIKNDKIKIRKILDILSCLRPFSIMASREKDIFAEYIFGYLKLKIKGYPKSEIFRILFSYDSVIGISDALSTKDHPISTDTVRNYTTKLRKKGLISEKSIEDKFLYLFENIGDEITFKLEKKDD